MNASIDFISTTIGDIADVISGPFGSQLHESDYKEHGTPIVTVEHLSPYGLTTQNLPFVGDEDKERLNRYTLKQGDIVFSRVGSVDRCSLVREKEEGWLFSGRLLRIRLNNSEKEMATLLSYIFQTNRFTHQVRSKAVGQTMPSLNNGIVKSLQISIPRNPKLQKIYCDTLINIDQKINLLTKKKEALETYKKGLMQKIFSQELRFKREDGTDYPEWKYTKLNKFLSLPVDDDCKVPDPSRMITVKLHRKGIVNAVISASSKLAANYKYRRKGQLIFGKQNLFNGAVGIVPEEFDGFLSSTDIPTLDINRNFILPDFLDLYFGRENFYKSLEKYAVGSGSKRIHQKTILNIEINLPSKEEQRAIAKMTNALDLNSNILQRKINEAQNLKQGLLQQMFV